MSNQQFASRAEQRRAEASRAQRGHIIIRNFRGERLYLESYTRAGSLFCWTNERSKAQRFETLRAAIVIAERAAIDYGADCATIDADGTMAQPAAAVSAEPHDTARAGEFPYNAKARERDHGPHCDDHVAFTDGCSACHVAHRESCAA